MTNNEIRESIQAIIRVAETAKNAYFWKPAPTAGGRRQNERRRARPEITWTEGGHTYTAEFRYQESCSNVYAYGVYTRDGKKTTLTAIRNSYNRLCGMEEE